MKNLILAVLAFSAICFAQSSELCNLGGSSSAPGIPYGSCYNVGYVCLVVTESSGGVRFTLGKNSACDTLETTNFSTYSRNSDGTLDTIASNFLRPYLQEGPEDNVGALAVAVNTAFIINAFNEKFKVRVTYHRVGSVLDENSVRLQAIGKAP